VSTYTRNPTVENPKLETPKLETPKLETPKLETPKPLGSASLAAQCCIIDTVCV